MIGLPPSEIDRMTIWHFQACLDGWKSAHSTEEAPPPAMSDDDAAALGIEGF